MLNDKEMLGGASGADVCCNDITDGHGVYTGGVMEQYGGRAAATTWPMQPGQALDVFFDGKDGAYQPGYFRGVIDTATTPSKTGIQRSISTFRTIARPQYST